MSKRDLFNIDDNKQLQSISGLLKTSAAALITIIGLRYIAQDLIAPVLMSLFFAILIYPIYKWFRNRKYSKNVSISLVILTLIAALIGMIIFISKSFGVLSQNLTQSITNFNNNIDQIFTSVGAGDNSQAENTINQVITEENIVSLIRWVVGSLGNLFMFLLIIPILSLMMVLQVDSIPNSFYKDFSKDSKALLKFKKFSQSITLYIVSRAKVNLVTGLLCYIGFTLFGIESAFLWGLLVFFLTFIPYIGLFIAGTPPVLLAFANNGITNALLVILLILGVNLFAENILEPYIQGKSNRISTAMIIIALIFWTWILGPLGAIMSVPLTVLLKIILEDYEETRWISALMEGDYEKTKSEISKKQNQNWKIWKKLPFIKGNNNQNSEK